MAKRQNTYLSKPPSQRGRHGDRGAGKGSHGAGRRLPLHLPRLRRPHPRREAVIVASVAMAAVLALGCLGGALLLSKINRDWATVATVNGHNISREDLRNRMGLTTFLATQRSLLVPSWSGLSQEAAANLRNLAAEPLADPVNYARESLIDDELVRELADRNGVHLSGQVGVGTELSNFVLQDASHQVRYVRFGLPPADQAPATLQTSSPNPWPTAFAANLQAAIDRLRTELANDTPVETIVAGLHDAGWKVLGVDTLVSPEGVPADPSLDLDPSIAAATVAGKLDQILGPTTDLYGRVSMGRVLPPPTLLGNFGAFLGPDAQKAGISHDTLQKWADAQALRRLLAAHLIAGWSKGVEQAHPREIVIGAAPDTSATAGPWVDLNYLSLDRLAGVQPSAVAGVPANLDLAPKALAKTLRAMPLADREALFGNLMKAANAAPSGGSAGSQQSFEMGFRTSSDIPKEIGKLAFGSKVKTGDVLGPIKTSSGSALVLVAARYPGPLDDHATAALEIVRADPAPEPAAYTTRFSPADLPLAKEAGWHAAPEFATTEIARSALFDTPIGSLSDPFILDGKLVVAIVAERRTAPPDARMLDRLSLDGFTVWLASARSKASIWRSADPMPELRSPTPQPTATSLVPPDETPNLPSVPGPKGTPVPTDPLGLPQLP